MLKKIIISTIFITTSVLITACDNNNGSNIDLSKASYQITAVSLLGASNEASTAIANGGTDSNTSTTDFEILLPLDGSTLAADPGDGSMVSDLINLQVISDDTSDTETVNIELVINPS